VPLIRSARPEDDDLDSLRERLGELDEVLRQRADELARARADLEAFRIRYRQEVGSLHEEHDELLRAIAEAEMAEKRKQPKEDGDGAAASPRRPRPEPLPRFTSDAVRKLFRDVAKAIHPDLARDADARDRRHSLMIEANRAYALGDEERLRWVLDAWENSPESIEGSDPEAARQRLIRRIAQIEDELDAYAAELAAMRELPLWRLKAMVDEAAGRGKDLMSDMIARLKRDIMAARNRLDAMQWCP
jgi:hypothetical protein